jgi:DNA-binding winged helix-turn-helix (wHTH) protein
VHEPVLLEEVREHLEPSRGGVFVDCTVGLGGHARMLLADGASRLIGLDRDLSAIAIATDALRIFEGRVELVHRDFRELAAVLDARGLATVDGVALPLTVHEFELLFLLASRAGQFVDREAIALRLHGRPEPNGRSADVHVYRIRRKLKAIGADRLRIDTVYGRGYLLSVDAGDARFPEVPAPSHPG